MTTLQLQKKDLAALESTLLEKLIVAPIAGWLHNIDEKLIQVAQTADEALEAGVTIQEQICNMKLQSDWFRDEILTLENRVKGKNLIFRGLVENAEDSIDLAVFMVNWLAAVFKVESGVVPLVERAYWQGSAKNPKRQLPREVANCHTKTMILREAHLRGQLNFQDIVTGGKYHGNSYKPIHK